MRRLGVSGVIALAAVAAGIALWRSTAGAGRDFAWEKLSGLWIDDGRLLDAQKQRAVELGEDAPYFQRAWGWKRDYLAWPDDAHLVNQVVPPERTAGARALCARELAWILKDTYVPADLTEHLVALSAYGRNGSDFLFARYRVNDYRIQVIYSGHATGILVVPRHPQARPRASRDYAMRVIRDIFVPMRPEDEPHMRGGDSDLAGIIHGSYTNSYRDATDALTGPSPWYAGSFITDGNYVFVTPAKWGLCENLDIRSSARTPQRPPLDRPILLFEPQTPGR